MSRAASSGGVELALHDLGGQGPTVLLAHANGFHGRVFIPLARHLAGAFHCVAVDLRGHGESVMPAGASLDWPRFADDVLAAVDAAGGRPLLGVGHSLGGAALALAEQDRPGTFGGLYLYEPILPPAPVTIPDLATRDNPMSSAARRRRSVFPDVETAIANYAAKPPLDALDPEALRCYVTYGFAPVDGGVELRCDPEVEARIFEQFPSAERFARLAEVQCPVTVAVGRIEEFGPAAFGPAVAEQFPHGRLERLDALGHFGPLEDPAAVAASIQASFHDLPPSP